MSEVSSIRYRFETLYYEKERAFKKHDRRKPINRHIEQINGILGKLDYDIVKELAYDVKTLIDELKALKKIKKHQLDNIDNLFYDELIADPEIIALFKGMEEAIKTNKVCPSCDGRGGHSVPDIIDHTWETCRFCNGTGKQEVVSIAELADASWDYNDFSNLYYYYQNNKGKKK